MKELIRDSSQPLPSFDFYVKKSPSTKKEEPSISSSNSSQFLGPHTPLLKKETVPAKPVTEVEQLLDLLAQTYEEGNKREANAKAWLWILFYFNGITLEGRKPSDLFDEKRDARRIELIEQLIQKVDNFNEGFVSVIEFAKVAIEGNTAAKLLAACFSEPGEKSPPVESASLLLQQQCKAMETYVSGQHKIIEMSQSLKAKQRSSLGWVIHNTLMTAVAWLSLYSLCTAPIPILVALSAAAFAVVGIVILSLYFYDRNKLNRAQESCKEKFEQNRNDLSQSKEAFFNGINSLSSRASCRQDAVNLDTPSPPPYSPPPSSTGS